MLEWAHNCGWLWYDIENHLYPLFPVPTAASGAQGCMHFAQLLLQPSPREYCHLGFNSWFNLDIETRRFSCIPFCSPQNLKWRTPHPQPLQHRLLEEKNVERITSYMQTKTKVDTNCFNLGPNYPSLTEVGNTRMQNPGRLTCAWMPHTWSSSHPTAPRSSLSYTQVSQQHILQGYLFTSVLDMYTFQTQRCGYSKAPEIHRKLHL